MSGSRETSISPGEEPGYTVVVVRVVMDDGRDILDYIRSTNPRVIERFEIKMAEKLMNIRVNNYKVG